MTHMNQPRITAAVKLDERRFRRFALYDAFIVRRLWVRPAIFAGIMLGFAFVALLLRRKESGLIAAVLLAIGLGLPVVWIGTYISQVHSQALRLHLKPPRLVYTITMTESGIHVQHARKNEESLDAAWSDIHSIRWCRGDASIYLSPTQAFILPAAQTDVSEAELKKLLLLSLNRPEKIRQQRVPIGMVCHPAGLARQIRRIMRILFRNRHHPKRLTGISLFFHASCDACGTTVTGPFCRYIPRSCEAPH